MVSGSAGSLELRSQFEHDARDGAFTVEFDSIQQNVRTYVELRALSSDKIVDAASIELFQAKLSFNYLGSKLEDVPYDPILHRFWQLRVKDDRLYFETAGDNGLFVEQTSTSNFDDFPLAHIYPVIGTSGIGVEGETRIGSINRDQEPAKFCGAGVFVDSFETDRLDELWSARDRSLVCSYSSGTGQLAIESTNGLCGVASGRAIDLEDDQIELRFDKPPDFASSESRLEFGLAVGANRVAMVSNGSKLSFSLCEGVDCSTRPGIDVGSETIWRVSNSDNRYLWQVVDPDGTIRKIDDFTPSFEFPPAALRVDIRASTGNALETFAIGGVNAP